MVADACGKEIAPEVPGLFRYGDTRHTVSSSDKLRGLGWEQTVFPRALRLKNAVYVLLPYYPHEIVRSRKRRISPWKTKRDTIYQK